MSTKTIDSSDLRNNLSDAIEAVVGGQTLIVKKRGKDQVAIIDIDAFEDLLEASNPEYLKSIRDARASKKRYTLEEAFSDVWDETR